MFAVCCLLVALPIASTVTATTDEQHFPLRPFYPTVKTIDTDRFLEIYFNAIIIDVRSRFEFDVVRINKAKHVPLSEDDFIASISRYRSLISETPMVFYCNDSACSSAFRAVLLARAAGYTNLFVYDAGVFPLLMVAPEKITLMVTTPAQPDLVISNDYYNKVRIDFKEFKERSTGMGTLLIDIRNIYNRVHEPRLQGVRNIPMESFLKAVTNRIWAEKKLLIFDQNGEKTNSLQYFLQANGYSNYVFLRGGMEGLDLGTQAQMVIRSSSEINLNQQRLRELTMDSSLTPLDVKLVNLLAGSVSFENHAVVKSDQLLKLLGCSAEQLDKSVRRLQDGGFLLFGKYRNSLIVHIDPRLAWKGKMSGDLWTVRVREYEASIRK
jgi:rhodanese-related sulfurtransferase